MDLQSYYHRIREIRAQIKETSTVVVSLKTADGGVEGIPTEVPAQVAAQMVVDSKARLATEEEAKEFRQSKQAAHEEAKEREVASRIQVTVVNADSLRPGRGKASKETEKA